MIFILQCVNLYIEKGQHAETCYPSEPVKKTVTSVVK
ncbi:TPA: hypothetical protein RSU77_001820 [Staphylococcus aureus]|nr:hypothetical protein [Staphylococcus aureus]MBH4578252.1 hypothetical protein [Staphylococcus aureus]MBH4583403.1 hypothetical protein [Staphylococcus aureus]MBH4585917.1 hypothetical protein [Staphylococcus aureus]MBH4588519.1 hypothetical protein [Staphylococcus aureus]MBH4591287.1 hypothetical protein [Staphylococcus aureus]